MKEQLMDIICCEIEKLKELLEILDVQHSAVVKNEVFVMEDCVKKLENKSREIAVVEVERRKITGEESLSSIIYELNDNELEEKHREINKLLQEIKLQNDTNEVLIKQGLVYTNKMLSVLNPQRTANTYNGYGKIKKR